MSANTQLQDIITEFSSNLMPKPKITGHDWINNNFYLSAESSSMAGKMMLHAYQEEIVDAMVDEWAELVVLEKSSRIGYNKLLNCAIGYFITQDPCTILFYSPNDQLAKDIAVTEINPMVRDNPSIYNRMKPDTKKAMGKGRKLIDTNMLKSYFGGYLQMLGANTPNNFAQRTARVVIIDELSRWLDNIGGEGDGVSLGKVRVSDFYNGKVIIGSSPTLKYRNKIGDNYDETDMGLYHLPCPHCHFRQPLEWENLKYDVIGDDRKNTLIVKPNTAHFKCVKCKGKIFQNAQRWMDNHGKWVKKHPKRIRKRGFRIWTAYGYSPKMTWQGIANRYLEVKNNPLKLQTFTNTVLGRSWDVEDSLLSPDALLKRKETYHPDYDCNEKVLMITMGVDTQNDRLELIVVGHGINRERWILDYHVLLGDPAEDEVWVDLERFYDELKYTHPLAPDGMGVYAMAIDSGGGRTSFVYDFCKPRLSKRIYPIKGANRVDAKEVDKKEGYTKKGSKYKITHFQVGVNKIKDYVSVGLAKNKKGANYIHLPKLDFVTDIFCEGLASEYKDPDSGLWTIKDDKHLRNEPWDCLIYAESAKLITGVNLDKLEIQLKESIKNLQKVKTDEAIARRNNQVQQSRGTEVISGDII